jgi:hypothetical protein
MPYVAEASQRSHFCSADKGKGRHGSPPTWPFLATRCYLPKTCSCASSSWLRAGARVKFGLRGRLSTFAIFQEKLLGRPTPIRRTRQTLDTAVPSFRLQRSGVDPITGKFAAADAAWARATGSLSFGASRRACSAGRGFSFPPQSYREHRGSSKTSGRTNVSSILQKAIRGQASSLSSPPKAPWSWSA